MLVFAEFSLDPDDQCLIRGGRRERLSTKDFALLHHLASHPRRTLSHAVLLKAAWGDLAVSADVLKVRIARLRRLLGDDATCPRVIATSHGEGYRFLLHPVTDAREASGRSAATLERMIGRELEMARVWRALERAFDLERQTVVVSGTAGIGKTMLLSHFAARARSIGGMTTDAAAEPGSQVWLGRGQCIEHYGRGEPFLAVLQALSELSAIDKNAELASMLRRHAPSWLNGLPSFRLLAEPATHGAETSAVTTPEHVLSELAHAVEVFSQDAARRRAIVLVIEDLQWADCSTLDLLRLFARRREPARLLVIATYRRGYASANGPALDGWWHDLHTQDLLIDVEIGPFTANEIEQYLDEHFQPGAYPLDLVDRIRRRTDGNPLLIKDVVRELKAHGALRLIEGHWTFDADLARVDAAIPTSLRHAVAQSRLRLSERDRRLLEAAATAGVEFTASEAASALAEEPSGVEEDCLRLARHQEVIRRVAPEEWPDGTRTTRFVFVHALYQELWQQEVGEGRKQQWHARIVHRLAAGFGAAAPGRAGLLAAHAEAAGEYGLAIAYHRQAAQNAMRRVAYKEATLHLDRSFDLLERVPSIDRQDLELTLQLQRGSLAAMTAGYGAAAAATAFQKAHELSASPGDAPQLFDAVFGLCRFFWIKGDSARAQTLAEQLCTLAERGGDAVRLLAAHCGLGSVLMMRGAFHDAQAPLRGAYELTAKHWCDDLTDAFASSLPVVCASMLGNALAVTGQLADAERHHREALRLADASTRPIAKAAALYGAALFHQFTWNVHKADECNLALHALSMQSDIREFRAFMQALDGWIATRKGQAQQGVEHLTMAASAFAMAGAALYQRWVSALLADALATAGRVEEAAAVGAEAVALIDRDGAGYYDAELFRIRGEVARLSAYSDAVADARRYFESARLIAHRQGARIWELRALLSRARVEDGAAERTAVRQLVAAALAHFDDTCTLPDVQVARLFART